MQICKVSRCGLIYVTALAQSEYWQQNGLFSTTPVDSPATVGVRLVSGWRGGGGSSQSGDAGAGARWEAGAEADAETDERAGRTETASRQAASGRPASPVRRLRQTTAAARAAKTTQRRRRQKEQVCPRVDSGYLRNTCWKSNTSQQFFCLVGSTRLFCSLAVVDPWVGHTMDVLTPYISVLCYSEWLLRGVLSTSWCCPSRPCVVFLACVHLAIVPCIISFSRQLPCFLLLWQ